jgi:hypothetical protein
MKIANNFLLRGMILHGIIINSTLVTLCVAIPHRVNIKFGLEARCVGFHGVFYGVHVQCDYSTCTNMEPGHGIMVCSSTYDIYLHI